MNKNLLLVVTTTTLVAIVSILLTSPTNLLGPPTIPTSHDHLHSAKILHVSGAVGPESLVFDPNGEGPYTGVADGRVLKWIAGDDGSGSWTDFATTSSNRNECVRPFAPEMEHVCGRPLGLRFDKKTGNLYIADAYLGLQVVGPTGGLATPVVTELEGQPMRFTNDLDIDEQEDVIYFTDTSMVFQRREFMLSLLTKDKTGRLLKYDKSSKEVTVLARGLAFANGVALSKDSTFLLVAETTTCRILRFWLHGPNAGKSDVFTELPGFPDNIRRNTNGEFWVALHSKKGLFAKVVLSNSWIGKTLLKFPLSFKQLHSLLVGGKAHATAIKLSEEGKILDVLEDCNGKTLRFISEVEEKDGKLWIGSVLMPFLGTYNL
ncbi:protein STRICTOSIDINE SYNTHASE-LIKE 10 [Populus alba]|uniref:Strictosidine synthase family protein n=2 Tax=Populus TaxID=3689 RepID=A0A4V6A768_POPAL|nr:protein STRICTOSIDINE SYNTHASE-LIKE 10-like [Populus alba]KAJ6967926.1 STRICTOSIDINE SYNTHASE-LIKE 10-like [Populus alba x Populus x berolinensis]TKR97855.1 strictosidine synthase family protein [Populus alba]